MKVLQVWTDGSCWPNPGKGAWAFVLAKVLPERNGIEVLEEKAGFELDVTNNRMEYLGLIKAFERIHEANLSAEYDKIRCFSDSNLLVQTVNIWMPKWKSNGWRRKTGKRNLPVANLDLVQRLDQIKANYKFDMTWVKGHSDIPLNERCDELCREEFRKRGLKSFEELRDSGNLFKREAQSVERKSASKFR